MSISYIFSKYELSILMSKLNINVKKFPYICKPITNDEILEDTMKSLYDKNFIIVNNDSFYIDKVINFIITQLGNSNRCFKINDYCRIYRCKNIMLSTENYRYNPNIVKVTPLKDVNMVNEYFNINLKEGDLL